MPEERRRIHELPKQMADKIAAGEVVDRPVSIVKELVENSIDAGSTSIAVEIKNGGKSYIRVTDNGCGIGKSELKSVFKPFYTTKRKKIGNGLGLDFVKRVVETHGGDIRIKSTEGVYTGIYIALPIYQRKTSKWI